MAEPTSLSPPPPVDIGILAELRAAKAPRAAGYVEVLDRWLRRFRAHLHRIGLDYLADPGGDRIIFWDDSAGRCEWLDLGSGLAITGTTLAPANVLEDLVTLGPPTTDGQFLVATGAGAVAWESGATARASMGLEDVAFLAYNSSTDSNVTGTSGTGFVSPVDFDTEIYDLGADFLGDTFTAPVPGKYLLCGQVKFTGITAAADDATVVVSTSNRNYTFLVADTNDLPGDLPINFSVIADMDAGDTAIVQARVRGEASDVVDIEGAASPLTTYFSGCLLR